MGSLLTIDIGLAQVQLFMLVFIRISTIFMFIPVFDSNDVPLTVKAGLTLAATITLFPILPLEQVPFITNWLVLLTAILGEIMLGAAIGLAVKFLFGALMLGGELAGYQMSLAMANILDPVTSDQVPMIAQFFNLFAMLLFLTLNMHHWLLRALVQSFEIAPPLSLAFSGSITETLTRLAGDMFVIAFKVAAPVTAALLLTLVALGMITRTVPKMNIFFVAMPLKIIVGLLFVIFSLPFLASYLRILFPELLQNIMALIGMLVS